MRISTSRSLALLLLVLLAVTAVRSLAAAEQHLLYVASPGTRNYTEYGGVGILIFEIDGERPADFDTARLRPPGKNTG